MLKRSFKRLFWRISDVCELTGLDQQTLRGWEQDFKQLRPRRDSSGVRVYRERELRLVILLNELIVEDKQDIAEVRRFLNDNKKELKDLLDAIDLDTLTEETDERLAPTSTVETEPAEEETPASENEPTDESVEEPEEALAEEETSEEPPSEEQPAEEVAHEETPVEAPPVEEVAVEEVELAEEPEPESEAEIIEEEKPVAEVEPVEETLVADETPPVEELPTEIPPEPIDTTIAQPVDESESVEAEETEPVEPEQAPPLEESTDEEPPIAIPPEPVETAPTEADVDDEPIAEPPPEPEVEEPLVLEAAPILNTRFALRFVDIADDEVSEQAEPEVALPLPDVDLPLEPTDVRFALAVVKRDSVEEPAVIPAVVEEETVLETIEPLERIDADEPVDVLAAVAAHPRAAEPVEPGPPPSEPLPGIYAEEPIDVHAQESPDEAALEVEATRETLDALVAEEPVDIADAAIAQESSAVEAVEQTLSEPLATIDADEPVDIHAALTVPTPPTPPVAPITDSPEPSFEPIPSLNADEPVDVFAALIAPPTPAAVEQQVATDEVVDAAADERFALSFVTPAVVDDESVQATTPVFEPLAEVITEEPTTVRDALAAPPPAPDDEPETVATRSYDPLPVLDAAEPVDLPRMTRPPVPKVAPLPLDAVDAEEPLDVLVALAASTPHVLAAVDEVVVDEPTPIDVNARFALAYITPAEPEPEPVSPQPTYARLDDVTADEPVDVLTALAATPMAESADIEPEPVPEEEPFVAPIDARFALAYVALGPVPEPEPTPEPAFEPLETVAVDEPVDLLEAEAVPEVAPIEELPELAVNERFALAFITPAPPEVEPDSTSEQVFEPLRNVTTDEPIAVLAALAAPPPATPDVELTEEPLIDEEPPDVEVDERFSLAYVTAAQHPEPARAPEPVYEPLAQVAADEPVDVLGPVTAPPVTPLVEPVSDRLPDWAAEELRLLRNDFVALLETLDAELGSDESPTHDDSTEAASEPENVDADDDLDDSRNDDMRDDGESDSQSESEEEPESELEAETEPKAEEESVESVDTEADTDTEVSNETDAGTDDEKSPESA